MFVRNFEKTFNSDEDYFAYECRVIGYSSKIGDRKGRFNIKIKSREELDTRGQKFRQLILDNPNNYEHNFVKCIFNLPGDPFEMFKNSFEKFDEIRMLKIFKKSARVNFEFMKMFEKRFSPQYVKYVDGIFFTELLDSLKLLISLFPEKFEENFYFIIYYNLTNNNTDILDFIWSNFEVNAQNLFEFNKEKYIRNYKLIGIDYLIKHLPNFFQYFPDRTLYCKEENANILAVMGFGKKLDLKKFERKRNFLSACSHDIFLKEYIDDYDIFEGNMEKITFLSLLEACDNPLYVYDFELLKNIIPETICIGSRNYSFVNKECKRIEEVLYNLSQRYPEEVRYEITKTKIDGILYE